MTSRNADAVAAARMIRTSTSVPWSSQAVTTSNLRRRRRSAFASMTQATCVVSAVACACERSPGRRSIVGAFQITIGALMSAIARTAHAGGDTMAGARTIPSGASARSRAFARVPSLSLLSKPMSTTSKCCDSSSTRLCAARSHLERKSDGSCSSYREKYADTIAHGRDRWGHVRTRRLWHAFRYRF